ncbi:unnamed protein product [Rodentolepis nana]|uniref:KRAB domain-containing protein n=1 Tax=Rodentolepis nana TaxID=102285 RepID=A0A0R3TTV5_RODNA|nr:unnamed protein product [Rodentolepis nana]
METTNNGNAVFSFDFEIQNQSQQWQALDEQTSESVEEVQHSSGKYFSCYPTVGDEFFNPTDPAAIKHEWLQNRHNAKGSVRNSGKQFLLHSLEHNNNRNLH